MPDDRDPLVVPKRLVHIRLKNAYTICGEKIENQSTISMIHYVDQLDGHVKTLPMCPDCVRQD